MRPYIIHTKQSKYLCDALNATLGFKPVPVIHRCVNGESYYRLLINKPTALLGRDVVVVSTLCSDEELLELFQIGEAVAKMGTRSTFSA